MPQNKRESLVFTVLMCGFMVYMMTIYNIILSQGFTKEVFVEAWVGLPLAYVVAIICDWFIVAPIAKKQAFKLIKEEDPIIKKVFLISGFMVTGMVILMSLFGAVLHVGISEETFFAWMHNIPLNFIMALPLQILIAGPVVRFVFRTAFPEGVIAD